MDYDTALKPYNQLVASKLAKGYTPGADGTPYQHTGHEGRATGIYPQLLEPVDDTTRSAICCSIRSTARRKSTMANA